MTIDHIFIFSSESGKEVDSLIAFGFSEGSSRVHPGQGTVNRKIYFENFFLEIIWVHNEEEIKSENVQKTKLWERSNFLTNEYSRFGLGFVNTPDTDKLFKNSVMYQPDYFPIGTYFEIIPNDENSYLPWTFRLPLQPPKKSTEPMDHRNGIRKLTNVSFVLNSMEFKNEFVAEIEKNSDIRFNTGSENTLTLEFDNVLKGEIKKFDSLNLIIKY